MAIDKIQSESINLADTFAFTGTVTGAGGVNTPAFRAYISTNPVMSNNTLLKIAFDTEDFDTANAYDNSTNYRFTPQTAGKYFVSSTIAITNNVSADVAQYGKIYIYKNGSGLVSYIVDNHNSYPHNQYSVTVSTLVSMNGSSDYLEIYGQSAANSNSPQIGGGSNQSWFSGYKIIE